MKSNWIDDVIGLISPTAKNKRLLAKISSEELEKTFKRGYDGAGRGRRTKGWKASNASPNAEIWRALGLLRARARDLVRNDAYASSALSVIESEMIGKGIVGQIKSSNSGRAKNFNELWRQWTESTAIDYDGVNTLAGLQKMVVRSMVEGGDVIVRLRFVQPDQPGLPPIKIQVLEGDFLDDRSVTFAGRLDPKNKVVLGVEFDPETGKRVQYHLYGSHPGALAREFVRSNIVSTPFPASEIAHIYRPERAGQVRGVTWFHSVMFRLKDFGDFEDAQLLRQKLAACHVALIKDIDPPETSSEADQDLAGEMMEPGTYEFLPPGKDIVFNNPPGVTNYEEYTSTQLHAIAAGMGISFEALTGNLKQVNFSSARMGKLRMNRNVDMWTKHILIPQFLNRVFLWWRQGQQLVGNNPRDIKIVWTPPKKELVDPTKEVPAIIKSIRGGITTLSETIRTHGSDPTEVLTEYAEDMKTLDRLGLSLDTDVRKVNQSGSAQPADQTLDPPPPPADGDD